MYEKKSLKQCSFCNLWTDIFRAHFMLRQNDAVPDRKLIQLYVENITETASYRCRVKWAVKALCAAIKDSEV